MDYNRSIMKTLSQYLEDVLENKIKLPVDFQKDFVEAGEYNKYISKHSFIDTDPEELRLGIEIEMEHTTNSDIAKRIALDHIAEAYPVKYYAKLIAMEKEIDSEKRNLKNA
jgi:hypothetical protein